LTKILKSKLKSLPRGFYERLHEKMPKIKINAIVFSTNSLATTALTILFEKHGVNLIEIAAYNKGGLQLVYEEKPDLVVFVTSSHQPNAEYLNSIRSVEPTPRILLIVADCARKLENESQYCDCVCLAETFQPEDLTRLLDEIQPQKYVTIRRISGSPPALTPRQTDVLRLIADGIKVGAIPGLLGISRQAADVHVKKLHQILGTEDLQELAVLGLRCGLVD
jgi:DNA-binding NarL/FixJ family response regulator